MRKAIVALATVLTLGAGVSGSAAAPQGPCVKPPAAVERVRVKTSLFDDPSLTKDQRTKLAALHARYFREMTALRQKKQEAMFAFIQAGILNPQDKTMLAAKYKAVEEARLPLRQKATEFRVELLKILTPEQQVKLWEGRGLWSEFPGKGGHGLGHRR